MKIIKKKEKISQELSYLFEDAKQRDCLFLDIETTGFSKNTNMVYLICLACPDEDNALSMTQLLAEDFYDEKNLLSALSEILTKSSKTLTGYNIKSFDIPFLNCRLEKNCLPLIDDKILDLYDTAKRIKKLLPMKSLKLKEIESFLGIFREDIFSGGELIPVFNRYVAYHEKTDEDTLLLHNFEDVKNLLPVTELLEIEKLKTASPEIEKTVFSEDSSLSFLGKSGIFVFSPFSLRTENYLFTFDKDMIKGTIRFFSGTMKHFLPDVKNYVFLTKEEKIIPKALSSSIPKELKRAAKKDECFVKSCGDFFYLPAKCSAEELFEDENDRLLFRKTFSDKESCIKRDRLAVTEKFVSGYAGLMIRNYFS